MQWITQSLLRVTEWGARVRGWFMSEVTWNSSIRPRATRRRGRAGICRIRVFFTTETSSQPRRHPTRPPPTHVDLPVLFPNCHVDTHPTRPILSYQLLDNLHSFIMTNAFNAFTTVRSRLYRYHARKFIHVTAPLGQITSYMYLHVFISLTN